MLESPIVKEQYTIGTDTVFDFGVKIFDPADVSCYVYNPDTKTETMLTSGTDFTVGMKPNTTDYSHGARITLLTTQPASGKLTIIRSVVPAQRVSLPNFGKIPSESFETQLDQNTAAIQQLTETVKLCYKIPWGASGTLTPLDSIRDIVSGMGGGGGGGAITWVESAGFADALDDNFVVKSATNATNAAKLEGATKAQLLASASSSTVNSATYATSATRVGGATKAQLLASASSSTVNSATYATSAAKLEGATKQQVIDSAVASAGGGGIVIPNYAGLTTGADVSVYSSGTFVMETSNLGTSTYYAMEDSYIRISIKNIQGYGCLRITIGGSEIPLMDVRSGGPGITWPAIPVSSGQSFKVTLYDATADLLVKCDHTVNTYYTWPEQD